MVENLQVTNRLEFERRLMGGIYDWTWMYSQLFRRIGGLPQGRTLDVGSYDERYARWLPSQNVQAEVISVDIREFDNSSERFIRASAGALPFDDNTFDHVVSIGAFPWFKTREVDQETALREMVRVATNTIMIWPVEADVMLLPSINSKFHFEILSVLDDDPFNGSGYILTNAAP